MCSVSMIMQHTHDIWSQQLRPIPTQVEIDEFHQLLEKARKWDREHNQLDCEMEEKKTKLKKLANELGIKITID